MRRSRSIHHRRAPLLQGDDHAGLCLNAADSGNERSADPFQTLTDRLFENGLVADSGLFGDPLRPFEVGDRNANRYGAGCVKLGPFHELLQHFRIGLRDFRSGRAKQRTVLERASKLALRLAARRPATSSTSNRVTAWRRMCQSKPTIRSGTLRVYTINVYTDAERGSRPG